MEEKYLKLNDNKTWNEYISLLKYTIEKIL
jgi:hypothetical protein